MRLRSLIAGAFCALGGFWATAALLRTAFDGDVWFPVLPPMSLERVQTVPAVVAAAVFLVVGMAIARAARDVEAKQTSDPPLLRTHEPSAANKEVHQWEQRGARAPTRKGAQDPRPKLRRYLNSLSRDQNPSGLHILVWTRELLEFLDDASYPTLRLYANWSVHTRLTKSMSGYELLAAVNHRLASVARGANSDAPASLDPFIESVTKLLSTAQLRRELRELLLSQKIHARFAKSYSTWNRFLASVFEEIHGKPIEFPNGDPNKWKSPKLRSLYESARNAVIEATGSSKAFVVQFYIDTVHVPEKHEDPTKGTLHWRCVMEVGAVMQAEVYSTMLEHASSFAHK